MPHKSDILSWRGKNQVSHSRETIDTIKQDQGKHTKGLTPKPRSKVDRQLK